MTEEKMRKILVGFTQPVRKKWIHGAITRKVYRKGELLEQFTVYGIGNLAKFIVEKMNELDNETL